jgi:thioredoxin 1
MLEVSTNFIEGFKGKLVVLFSASWCKPCQSLKPPLATIEAEYPKLTFVMIDVDKHPEVATKYSVRGVPTVLFLDCQQEMGRAVGLVSPQKIREMLNC